MRVRLTGNRGERKIYEVVNLHLNTATGELRLLCRDQMEAVLQVENIEVLVTESLLPAQTSDEIRRATDESPLIAIN